MKPFFISVPHSGEKIPSEASWLKGLAEVTVMRDVDRFVDRLYAPAVKELELPWIIAEWHRYVADLNRLPEDVDQGTVQGASASAGAHRTGLHWQETTQGEKLISEPIPWADHQAIVERYYQPFHQKVKAMYEKMKADGALKIYQLDAHSMPSQGTSAHRDPGQRRSEVVVSDFDGQSCEKSFRDLVVGAYETAGFQVACNWPYKGGRITQTYGHPELGQHVIQVELNRDLYMNETTKQLKEEEALKIQKRLLVALRQIHESL